ADFDEPRIELLWPGDRVAPGDDLLALQPLVAVLRVFVDHPFADIAVHVEQAPGVGLLLTDEMHPLARVVEEPAVLAKLLRIIAEGVRRGGACPAGIFPLGLGWQAEVHPGDAAEPLRVLLGCELTLRNGRLLGIVAQLERERRIVAARRRAND